MNPTLATSLLAACAGLIPLAMPATGHAANVGYYGNCGGGMAEAITAAGHTPVRITSLDAASLAPLATLMSEDCGFTSDQDVTNAVANGMTLVVHDWFSYSGQPVVPLPGNPGVAVTYAPGDPEEDIQLPAGSPIISGPGGTLTNTSLDGGSSSFHGYASAGALPAGSTVLATTVDPSRPVAFSYTTGRGRVVFSTIPLGYYASGTSEVANGMRTYATNLIAWATGPLFTTCAAEGYTGSKLTLCRSVCEAAPSATLTNKIKLYTAIYRETPPCGR